MERLLSREVGELATVMYSYLPLEAVHFFILHRTTASFVDRHFPILNQLLSLRIFNPMRRVSYKNRLDIMDNRVYKIRYLF
jgi:hypothetical protein